MKKKIYLLLFCVALLSCEKENVLNNDSVVPQTTVTTLQDIKEMGFSIDHAQTFDKYYVVEGDIVFFKDKKYNEQKAGTNQLKHYTIGDKVILKKNIPLKIFVSADVPRGTQSWYDAVVKSISNWNSVTGTELRFALTTNEAEANIKIVSDNGSLHDDLAGINVDGDKAPEDYKIVWAQAEYPIGGEPGASIKLNLTGLPGVNDPSYLARFNISYDAKVTQISHTIGHTIGFAHSNPWVYMKHDKGTTYLNEGREDGSVSMMDFLDDEIRIFSANDIKAIQTLFPVLPRFITCDNIISFNFDGDNFSDLFFYRAGQSIVYVEKSNGNGSFSNVISSYNGIAGYDFAVAQDQAISLDYDGDGKDDILTYRPGQGIVYLAKSNGYSGITNVFRSGSGLAGYDFSVASDRAISLDFNGDGKDDILTYRPGQSIVYIAKSNGNGTFTNVFASRIGIAGYDFNVASDQVISLDYNGDGKDDILTYRPGQRIVYLAKSNGDGGFSNVMSSGSGIAGYDFATAEDRAISLDFNGDGKDDILTYRPGQCIVYVAKSNGDGGFSNVMASRTGVAGFDFANTNDKVISFNYNNDGKDDILCYRSGTAKLSILISNGDGSFSNAYNQ